MVLTTNSLRYRRVMEMAAKINPQVLTAGEISKILGVSTGTVRGYIKAIRGSKRNRKVYSASTRNGGYALSPAALPKKVARFTPVVTTTSRSFQSTNLSGNNEVKVFNSLNAASGVITAGEIARQTGLTIYQVRSAIKNIRKCEHVFSFPTRNGGYCLADRAHPSIWRFAA